MRKVLTLFIPIVLLASCRDGKPTVTFVVESAAPYNTSKDTIYVAGNFNNWNPKDPKTALRMLGANKFGNEIEIPAAFQDSIIEYKYTRGSWEEVEFSQKGEDLPNRKLPYKKKAITALDKIASWEGEKKKSTATAHVKVWEKAFEIPQLNRMRRVWVCLPSTYEESEKKYPVIYLHDGQNLFDNAVAPFGEWGVDETMLELERKGIEAIVVGIDHGDSLRINEYSPYPNEKYGGGEGDEYLEFIVKTLKPAIDEEFRTLPNREETIIGGSSLGGLISFFAATKYPEVFGKYLLFSPSFWFNKEAFAEAEKIAQSEEELEMYMLVGGDEGKEMTEEAQKMMEVLRGYENVNIEFKLVTEGKHSESFWSAELQEGLSALMSN